MKSAAQLAANRQNSARSTGPRTRGGRQRSSRNAFRHGLSLPMTRGDDFSRKVEALTKSVKAVTGAPPETAALIAEARLHLLRARQAATETIKQGLQQVAAAQEHLSHEERVGLAVAAKAPQLAAIARYERRAWSRLKNLLTVLELEAREQSKGCLVGKPDQQSVDNEGSKSCR